MEIWKDIKGYEGKYQVSNLGNVKTLKRKRKTQYGKIATIPEKVLKPTITSNGYLRLNLYIEAVKITYLVHRLVAQAFIDNPNNYNIINHKNCNKEDNRVENLEWCTQSHNRIHALQNNLGLVKKGQEHARAKLTNDIILNIRNDNRVQHIIAKHYNISQSLVSRIKLRKLWNHI